MKTFMGVTQNWDGPDIIDFILARRRDPQEDRGPLHRHEDVVVLRVPESRRRRSSTTLADAFLANDLVDRTTSCAAIFNHPAFLSDAAKQGLVRIAGRVGRRRACARSGITAERREPAVVDGRHGPAAVRAAERVGLAAERVLAHDLARVGRVRTGRATSSGRTSVGDTLKRHHER